MNIPMPETLHLHGRVADETDVMVARNPEQTVSVRFRVDPMIADALWEMLTAKAKLGVTEPLLVHVTPEQVVSIEKVEWHEYRPGMPAGND